MSRWTPENVKLLLSPRHRRGFPDDVKQNDLLVPGLARVGVEVQTKPLQEIEQEPFPDRDYHLTILHPVVQLNGLALVPGEVRVRPDVDLNYLLPFPILFRIQVMLFGAPDADDPGHHKILEGFRLVTERPHMPAVAIECQGMGGDPPPFWLRGAHGLVVDLEGNALTDGRHQPARAQTPPD